MHFPRWKCLVRNRRQAITWTNDDPVQWGIYVSPGFNVLIKGTISMWYERNKGNHALVVNCDIYEQSSFSLSTFRGTCWSDSWDNALLFISRHSSSCVQRLTYGLGVCWKSLAMHAYKGFPCWTTVLISITTLSDGFEILQPMYHNWQNNAYKGRRIWWSLI